VFQMALRGFLAALVDYDNAITETDDDMCEVHKKADNIFRGTTSALGVLCAMNEADCSKGVAVSGHSQGGFITILSAKSDARITAQLPLAVGMCTNSKDKKDCACYASSTCFTDFTGAATPKRRFLFGEDDVIVGLGDPKAYLKEIKQVSGYDCGSNLDCIQGDGSGYFVMTKDSYAVTKSGCKTAPHSFWWDKDTAGSPDAKFVCASLSQSAKFAMPSSLDWLASAAVTSGQPLVNGTTALVTAEGQNIACSDVCPEEEVDLCGVLQAAAIFGIAIAASCCFCCCVCAVVGGIAYYRRRKN